MRADGEPGHPGVDLLPVRGHRDLAAYGGDALDADENLHEASSDPLVRRVKQRGGAGDRDRDRVLLAHILHQQRAALDREIRGQVGHQQVLAHRRPRARAGHVRRPALGVDQALASERQDRLAAEHVTRRPVRRRVRVHGQRAQHRARRLGPLAQVRLLADERLFLHLRPGHAGLGQRVVRGELGAERAVPLLQPPGRAVHADAGRHQAVRLARLPQRVPQPGALLDRRVQFPAELADVGNARREHDGAADLDLAAGAEREPRVRHIVGRHRRQHVPGPRPPQPDRRPGRGEVGEERPGGRWSLIHLASDIPVAPPVTTRNRSAASRMTVRSARKPPFSSSHEV